MPHPRKSQPAEHESIKRPEKERAGALLVLGRYDDFFLLASEISLGPPITSGYNLS